MKIYKVVFEKISGETKFFLAQNFDSLVTKAEKWGAKEEYGTQLQSIELIGEVEE